MSPIRETPYREVELAMESVGRELNRAYDDHGNYRSAHEGYAVILEEVRELEREVFAKQGERYREKMKLEASHIAVTAIRFMVDVCGVEP